MIKLITELEVENELGEGVIWDTARRCAWWTDIEGKRIYQYDPVLEELSSWQTPERLACFAPVVFQDVLQECLVAAFESGFAYYHPQSGALEWIEKIEADNPGTRLNDGRTDRQGRFWAGSMVESTETATGKGQLYCLDDNLEISAWVSGLLITNSLCWSTDSSKMYHCDTPTLTINAYEFDPESGQVGEGSVFTNTESGCYPDGSIIDSQNYMWNAQWGGSKVARYAPDGSQDLAFELPVSQPSCVAFGGKDLNLLFVTSAHQDLDTSQRAEQPGAGNVFIYQTDYVGLAESPFLPKSNKGFSLLSSQLE